MPISNSDISIGYEKISNYIKSIADGSKNVTDILNNLSDVVKKTNRDITGSLADTLGLTNKDKLGKLGSKWVQNYKKSLQERQESYGFTFYEGAIDPALINKKYATGSLAKEKISEYNQLIRQLKSEDVTISGQANDSIQNLIESLKKSNSELGTYLENARNAIKDDEGNDNIESLQELNDEDFMSTQREEIKKILSGGGVRQVIEEYNALSDASGNVSNDQQTMIDALRGTDDALADFLEQNPSATWGQYARAQAVATLKTIGLELATTALNAAISFGLSVAIQAAVTGITALIHKYDDLREANAEVAEEYKKTTETYDDFKTKLEEVHKVLEDETSTDQELYDARSELLNLQSDIIDAYGAQAQGIGNVNAGLEDEIKNLKEAARLEAIKNYNKYDQDSYQHDRAILDDVEQRFLTVWDDATIRAQGESMGATEKEILANLEYAKKVRELYQKYGYEGIFDLNGNQSEASFGKYESAYDQRDTLTKVLDELSGIIPKSAWIYEEVFKDISDELAAYTTDEFQAIVDNVDNIDMTHIATNASWVDLRDRISDSIAEYYDKIASGDALGAEEALKTIEALKTEVDNLKLSDSEEVLRNRFYDMFDRVQADLSKKDFIAEVKVDFAPSFQRYTDGTMDKYIQRVFDGLTDADLKNFDLIDSTDEQKEAYALLQKYANEFELSIDNVIDALASEGLVFSKTTDAAKYTTTNYSSMLEEVDALTEALDKFDSAQQKVMSGSSLTADEVNELIKLYPELVNCVNRTADGYTIAAEKISEARKAKTEEEKKSLIDDIARSESDLAQIRSEITQYEETIRGMSGTTNPSWQQQGALNNAKEMLKNRQDAEKEVSLQLAQQKLLLEQILNPTNDWVSILNDAASKFETITDQILKMRTQMSKLGSIDPTAALDFMQNVPNWQEYLSIDGGKITFNDMDNTALAEMIKKSSGLDAVYSEISGNTDKVTAANAIFEAKLKSVKNTLGGVNTEGKTSAEILSEMQASGKYTNKQLEEAAMRMGQAENGITATGNAIEKSEDELSFLDEVLKSIIESFKSSDAVNEFNNAVADLDHALAMGWITQDQYDAGFSGALSTLKTNAADNDEEAQDLIDDGLEKEHDAKLAKMQRDFDAEKLLIDNAREDLQMSVLEYRDAYAALNEAYYAPGTALGNTEDGKKQYAANLREIEKLSSEAYDNITSRFQSAIDFGKIIDPNIINDLANVFKGQELPDAVAQVIQKGIETGIWNATDLATIAPYLTEALLAGSDVNSEAYQNAINQQKDYVISAFEYEKTQLDNQLEAGLISSGDFIDEYTKLWEKYYKDKKEFAEEDLQTQKDILEAHKSEIQKQIDALEAYSENQTEPYQNEIDALNDVKDAYDDMMDDRIDALEKEKKAIEKKNEEQEEANDLQEKWLNLQKASMNKRLVYMGNGGWQLKRDEEEYNNAKKEYDEAKKEDATAKIDKAIEKLEEEKEARDKAIDKDIDAREKAIERIQKPIDDLTKVLTLLVTEQQNIDPEFIAQLLKTESADEALALINKKNSFGQKQETKYGVDANYDQLTTETINKLAKEAEKRNQTLDEYAKSLGLNLSETVTNANQNTIDKLLAEYNKLVSDRKSKGSDYGEVGHIGKVDYNNRPINLNEDDYNTLLGTTLSYESIANMFDEYLKGNNIESKELWNICEALWDIVETNENMHFNVSPLRPDGTAITNLNGNDDQFFGGIYDYILSQLTNGIRLEDMDIFMGGNYASGEIADKAAQEAHNDSAKMYDQEAEILRQLIALGYDVNQLDGVKYTGEIPTQPETQDNTKSTDANTDAINKNTEAVEKAAATTTDTTADATETNKNLDANSYLINSNGKQVLNDGKPIKPLTHDEWAKKHKVSEWATPGRSVNENMTMEQYETLKKGQKNGIIPASIVDIADITDEQLKQFLGAIQSNTKIAPQNVNTAMKPIADIANEAIQTYNNSPIINFSVQVDGSADEKTIQAMETKIGNMLINYTDKLTSSIATSSLRRQNKS